MAINFIKNGIDTSDATATANDIIENKTAYVDGEKITGNIDDISNGSITITYDNIDIGSTWTYIAGHAAKDYKIGANTDLRHSILTKRLASDIGLTADKIKKDETILGVTGTLEGKLEINPSNTFADDTAKQFYDIQTAYDNMQPRVLTKNDKTIDKNIYCIPTKSDGTPLLDTSQLNNTYELFKDCTNLKTIPLLNTSNVVSANSMFWGCTSLITIPLLDTSNVGALYNMFHNCTSLTEIPLLDTSNAYSIHYLFDGCTSLTTVPQLDMSSATNMYNMFSNCKSLLDESLNNILASLLTATVYTDTKTLKYIGLSETQATTCTTLSNWAACEAAGWTTGY